MAKTKISEYDATAANNTDINSINIAEGCAPSGINNAIRETMAALKRFQTGADGDPLTVGGNLVVSGSATLATTAISSADINAGTIDGTTIGGSTPAAGTFTTLASTGNTTLGDASGDSVTINAGTTTFAQGTANGVTYLNGSKVLTSGSALTFDGTTLAINTSSIYDTSTKISVGGRINTTNGTVTGTLNYGGGTVVNIGSLSDHPVLFIQNNSEKMRLTSTGLGIGTSSLTNLLTLNATSPSIDFLASGTAKASIVSGGGGSLAFYTGGIFGGSGSERMRIDSSGNVLVGHTYGTNIFGTSQNLSSTFNLFTIRASANATGPLHAFVKSRNASIGSFTIVQSGDTLGRIWFAGDDGVDYDSVGASIEAQVDGTPGSNDMPGRLVFSTTADGSASPTERMRIDSSGNVGIGTSSPISGYTLTLSNSTSSSLVLQRTSTTTTGGLWFFANNASASSVSYAGILGQPATTTAGSEAGNLLFYTKNAGSIAERMRIDSAGRMLIGYTSNLGITDALLQVSDTTDKQAIFSRFSNNSSPSTLIFTKSLSGTLGTNTALTSGDNIGTIQFRGADGTNYIQAASITATVDGTPGSNDMPGRLVFSTTADGSASPTERMRITSDGYLRMASGSGGIQFNGDTAAANALDDYEEGTWTPVFISASGSFSSITYQNRTGTYVKIGSVVYVTCNFYTSAISVGTASGAVRISGLPFTASSTEFGIALKGDIRTFAGEEPIAAQVDAGSTYIGLYYRSSVTGDGAESQVSDLGTGAGSNIIGVTGFYFV